MSEEIELGGIKVPAADLEATPESIKLVLKFLLEERKQTLAKIEALEERVNKNSKNSSIPPSKNGFGVKNSHQVTAKRKPLKLQSRRIKQERKLYEAAECVATHEFKPSNCSSCGYELTGEDLHPTRHQIVDLPVLKPLITEYRLHQLECEHCGDQTRASLPSFVSPKCYGARLAAFVAMLSGESRQSHRQVKTFLSQVFGIELARGTINRMRQEISSAVAAATTEAMEFTKQQPVVNCDETGFSQQNKDGENPNQKKAWLWVLVTPLVSVFMVTLSRSQDIAKELIGESFLGYLGSDRYSSYGWVNTDLRQLCWSHLLRDFQAISERSGVSQEIGLALLARGYRLFHWWHRVRDGTLERELFLEAVTLLRVGFHQELLSAAAIEIGSKETTPLAKTVRTCRKLLQVESALWTFVYHESIEPTNNSAERALRSAVIWRNLSFGSQSSEGSKFVARMLTVNCSLKAQGRSILDFLTESCLAARLGLETPSLIPTTQDEHVCTPPSTTLILS
jgi:transposase